MMQTEPRTTLQQKKREKTGQKHLRFYLLEMHDEWVEEGIEVKKETILQPLNREPFDVSSY